MRGGERRNTEQPRNDGTIPEQRNNTGTPDIRGHKGQNSTRTRSRGFLVLESPCRVYVPPRPRFRCHRENKKITHNLSIMLLKSISVVQIYVTSICIMYA